MTTLIGLTGGIGSGKSTVSNMLKELGVKVIDADQVGRELMEPGHEVYSQVVNHFGPSILCADGTLDRSKLGAMVFGYQHKLEKLESLTHPAIISEMDRRFQEYSDQGERLVAFEVPLLIEKNMQHLVDEIWLVICSEDTQLKRVMARGFSESDARTRIVAQMPLKDKIKYADRIIDTDGTLQFTRIQVIRYWSSVCGCILEG
ncbi:MAG: dephospho-CoA kinase [Bacillota bacterium]|nr:MAG: dephospho-CoA kinase [Bacillota bacterium]MBS3949960.1 dephospho-CoA kinase [Peptococcaceae bacterium]